MPHSAWYTKTASLTGLSLLGGFASFGLDDAKGLLLFLGSAGLGVGTMAGACWGAAYLQRVKTKSAAAPIEAETRKIEADARAHEIKAEADARAYAIKAEAEAHHGTCQELLEKANIRIDDMAAWQARAKAEGDEARAERGVILDEVKSLRLVVVELTKAQLQAKGWAQRES